MGTDALRLTPSGQSRPSVQGSAALPCNLRNLLPSDADIGPFAAGSGSSSPLPLHGHATFPRLPRLTQESCRQSTPPTPD